MCKKGRSRVTWALLLLTLFSPACTAPDAKEQEIVGGWLAPHGGKDLLTDQAHQALKRMRSLGIKWLAVGPEVHMKDIHKPELEFGKLDKKLRKYLKKARALGFEILLMPRIESPAFFRPPYPFRADIEMKSDVDWMQFYENYERMLVHYAKLSKEEGVGMLSIGLEYRKSVNAHPGRWREMAEALRKVYNGKLTYSANWYKEYEEVKFWKSLDIIGIGAYFEVAPKALSTRKKMALEWKKIKHKLWKLHVKTDRPVMFTELGFTTFSDAGRYPWKWQGDQSRKLSPQHQADCFEAFFQTMLYEDWFRGFFLWRFYTYSLYVQPWEYTPEGKEAELVLRSWFAP